MTDNSKCGNQDCPKRDTCYRAMATDGDNQSWVDFAADAEAGCFYYWHCPSKSMKKRLDVQLGD